MPSANPWRSALNQPETKGTPTANEAPATPRRKPTHSSAQYALAYPKSTAGRAEDASSSEKTSRPPSRSVAIPRGTRASEPSTTGIAVKNSASV